MLDNPSMSKAMTSKAMTWRTPAVIVLCGCLISLIGFGPRSALGLFLTPMSTAHGWPREIFALSVAVQTLLYGAAQPFSGAIADRFGTVRVIIAGALLYAAGIYMMAQATTPGMLYLSSGVLIGFGLSGCSFTLVISSFGQLLPESWRSDAPAPGTAPNAAQSQTYKQALAEAFGHRCYILLVLGFFTCGFQLGFVTLHLPAYLLDRGLSAEIGGWTLGVIGLFNIVGAMLSGWLGGFLPKRYILSVIYFARALTVVFLITLPASPVVTLIYGAVTGLLWLSSVPPTSGLVALMFGTRWMAMLFGIAFFSHQVGGFLGVYLGGLLFERTGSYDVVWWLSILLGVLSAAINLPI